MTNNSVFYQEVKKVDINLAKIHQTLNNFDKQVDTILSGIKKTDEEDKETEKEQQ